MPADGMVAVGVGLAPSTAVTPSRGGGETAAARVNASRMSAGGLAPASAKVSAEDQFGLGIGILQLYRKQAMTSKQARGGYNTVATTIGIEGG